MTSVPNDKSNIILARKVNAGFDMLLLLSKDDIFRVVTESAGVSGVSSWKTSVIGPEDPKISDIAISAVVR